MPSNQNQGNTSKGVKYGYSSKTHTNNMKLNNPKDVNRSAKKSNLDMKQIRPGTPNRATKSEKNSQDNLDPTDEKSDFCDKESSTFEGVSQENKRPIIRVNLIKKSNKPALLSSVNRKLLLSKPEVRRNIQSSVLPSSSPSIETKKEELSTQKDNLSFHEEKSKNIAQDKNGCVDVGNEEQSNSNLYNNKSSKAVITLIKELSEKVTKEELCEMLKELSLTIDEIQKKQFDSHAGSSKPSHSNSSNNSNNSNNKNANKKRQDQPKKFINSEIASNSSDSRNLSDPKKENHGHQSSLDSVTNSASNKINKKNLTSKPKIENNLDILSHDSDSSDLKGQKLSQQLMEFFSDEENGKEGVGMKRNFSRLPDRCLRITSSHAKYISPHRKRSLEERLNRAQEAREKFLEYRANKFRDILKKVEEMRAWKEEDTMNLKTSVQTKLQKAATKRKEQLDKIIRKAHDEDSKVSEIQFINNLEAQNRRHDMNSRKKECEARLQDLQDERQRRFEEKLAKEAAAEERRKTLEAERKAKLLEIQQRRRIKNQKVEQQQQVKEKKRIERNRNRERKISAIKEAYNAGVQTLKSRIHQKQEQSERRHEVNLRLIRQKAFELSIKRYNSFISETRGRASNKSLESNAIYKQKETPTNDTKRLQLKPFNTKKFCNLCKDTISSESALFSHLRSEAHLSSINEHYGNTMLTTNEAVEIHNLRHIVETDEPLDSDKGANSDDQQSSRASSLVNYYHSSYYHSQMNVGISMSESDRESLLAIEKKCRKLRHKLIAAGKPFNRDWFVNKIRYRLAKLLIQQRVARNQSTNTDPSSIASTIDLSPNNPNCQQNKPLYLKISRITRELINVTTDQRISGGGLLPANIIHTVDRLLADLTKQLCARKPSQLLYSANQDMSEKEMDANQLAVVTKMIEFHAIDTLFLYDVVSCLVSILRKMVPNVSLTNKLPSTVASHYSTLIDPISLNSYYCYRSPILPARIYLRMIGLLQQLCTKHSDLCYSIFQSNNMINLSDILSYRLGFIIGNESPASSISGSSSAATLSAHTIDRNVTKQQHNSPSSSSNSHQVSIMKTSSAGGSKFSKSSGVNLEQQLNQSDEKEKDAASQSSLANFSSKQVDEEDGYVGDEEESDFWERAETYKRTEDVVDDMTASLCKLLATVTETILTRPLILIDQSDKVAFDQRSDDFITYMVSVGIVDTESVIMSHIHQQQHHNQQQQHQQQQTLSTSNTNINSISPAVVSNNSNSNSNNNNTTSVSTSGAVDKSVAFTNDQTGPQTSTLASSTIGQNASSLATNSHSTSATAYMNKTSASSSATTTSMSTSNKIINFTTSCIEFVTSLVKLVTAKLSDDDHDDDNNEARDAYQQQQDSTQLLETLKMTQLSGVLTLVYDMLVHSFNSLTDVTSSSSTALSQNHQLTNNTASGGGVASSTNGHNNNNNNNSNCNNNSLARQLNLALHSLRLINYVAYIDVKFVQLTLKADEMLPLQLRHVCSYLIKYLVQTQFKIVDYKQQYNTNKQVVEQPDLTYTLNTNHNYIVSESELNFLKNELMNEIILLVGNFAYLDQDNQLILISGRQPTIIEQLISVPFDYFSRENLKLVLMPSLISCAYLNDQICSIICSDLSMSLFTAFIEDQLLWAQSCDSNKSRDKRSKSNSLVSYELTSSNLASNRWQFDRRFAKSKWLSAKKYFEAQREKMR